MNIDANEVLSIMVSLAGIAVLLLYRGIDTRVFQLEAKAEHKEDAKGRHADIMQDLEAHSATDARMFQSLEASLREFRIETKEQFQAARAEQNEKRSELRNDLISNRRETNEQLAGLRQMLTDLQDERRTTRRRG